MKKVNAESLVNAGEIMSKNEVAQFMRCCPRHIDNLVARRLLPCSKLGRRVLFRRSAVLAAIEKLES